MRAKGGRATNSGQRRMVGPASHRPPRQRVGEHPLYKTAGAPPTNAQPVAADFPVLRATRRTTAADFPALNGEVWQGPSPSAEDFPATLGAAGSAATCSALCARGRFLPPALDLSGIGDTL